MKINEINNFTLKELLGVKFYDEESFLNLRKQKYIKNTEEDMDL